MSFRLTAAQKTVVLAAREAAARGSTGAWLMDLIATSGDAPDRVQLWALGEIAAFSDELLPLLARMERSRAA